MGRSSVAVLDIRSSEIAVFVGERGINNTFAFKASKTESYNGYENGAFLSADAVKNAIFSALTSVEQICSDRIRELYVGVPGAFTVSVPRECEVGYPKKRKVTQKDLDALAESKREKVEGYSFIRASSAFYCTSDNRRVVDPIGIATESLYALISYCYASDYFIGTMEKIFRNQKIRLRYLPTELAMANYLIPSETRDECALFLDVGFYSSTVCVLLGNGVIAQKSFAGGRASIAAVVASYFAEIKLPFEAAGALLARANLFGKSVAGESFEFIYRNISYEISQSKLVEAVKEGLDLLCESVSSFFESGEEGDLADKHVFVSGEGLSGIRGALEHLSKRISRVCELVAPDLPYYNKPDVSSRIALTDMAYDDHRRGGLLYRLLNGFGG